MYDKLINKNTLVNKFLIVLFTWLSIFHCFIKRNMVQGVWWSLVTLMIWSSSDMVTTTSRSSRLSWRAAKIGNRSVAVLARRPDVDRDRRSVEKEASLRELEDLADAWLSFNQPAFTENNASVNQIESDAEDIKTKESHHRKRHGMGRKGKRRRRRRNKNNESRRTRKLIRRKKLEEKGELEEAPLAGEGEASFERLAERKKRRRRGYKKKNKDKNRKNSKDRKKKKKRKNKKRRKARKNDLPLDISDITKEALESFPIFQNQTELKGTDACQYKNLKQCTLNVGIFIPDDNTDPEVESRKCYKRKKFLECMEKMREFRACGEETVVEGNILALRDSIRAIIWTNSSCILTEALKGK